jgi:hypothetical protein
MVDFLINFALGNRKTQVSDSEMVSVFKSENGYEKFGKRRKGWVTCQSPESRKDDAGRKS